MLQKEQYKTKEDKWTRVRVFHPDFKHDTRVSNPDIEMHLDFGITPISTRLWTRVSFHQRMVLWFYGFIYVFFFFFTGCRAARPWSRDYHMPVWHGSGKLLWIHVLILVTSSSRRLNDSHLVSGRNISAVSSVGTGWSLKVSQVPKQKSLLCWLDFLQFL